MLPSDFAFRRLALSDTSERFLAMNRRCTAPGCVDGHIDAGDDEPDRAPCPQCKGTSYVARTALELLEITMPPNWPVELTPMQKLHALAYRYYGKLVNDWTPKEGDLYTSARADMDLYQVVGLDDDHIYTRYRNPARADTNHIAKWTREEFLANDTFGLNRVYVPNWVFMA
jgi:hypothetical protein